MLYVCKILEFLSISMMKRREMARGGMNGFWVGGIDGYMAQ